MPSRYVYMNDEVYARLVHLTSQQENKKLNDVLRECIQLGLKVLEEKLKNESN